MIWTALGWILWAFVALLTGGILLSGLSNRDGGMRFLMGTQGLMQSIGLGVTAALGFSKLHLLWIVPFSVAMPMLLMSFRVNRAVNRVLDGNRAA